MVDFEDMLERAEESMGGRKKKKAGKKKEQLSQYSLQGTETAKTLRKNWLL
jgi:hypothetical protein